MTQVREPFHVHKTKEYAELWIISECGIRTGASLSFNAPDPAHLAEVFYGPDAVLCPTCWPADDHDGLDSAGEAPVE